MLHAYFRNFVKTIIQPLCLVHGFLFDIYFLWWFIPRTCCSHSPLYLFSFFLLYYICKVKSERAALHAEACFRLCVVKSCRAPLTLSAAHAFSRCHSFFFEYILHFNFLPFHFFLIEAWKQWRESASPTSLRIRHNFHIRLHFWCKLHTNILHDNFT